jgi:hypothetical protein
MKTKTEVVKNAGNKQKKTGIYNIYGAVEQKDIDLWCGMCRFPTEGKKCQDKKNIQLCWSHSDGHQWHLEHECPFHQKGMVCRCNDYKSFKESFEDVGLKYKPSLTEVVKNAGDHPEKIWYEDYIETSLELSIWEHVCHECGMDPDAFHVDEDAFEEETRELMTDHFERVHGYEG